MRLNYHIVQKYNSVLNFWQNSCNLTLGRYEGYASLKTISRIIDGTVPVPLKGRKKVWLDNVNQTQLESALDDIDPDIEAFALTGSPTIKDFNFLERFPKLKVVYLWWNYRATTLWDMTKTPDIEFLQLRNISKITDITQLQNAKKLRYLNISEGKNGVGSLKPLERHPSLEFVFLLRVVDDMDMRPLITVPNLKYLHCHFNLFDIDSYAMFEAKRPDVDTNFWEGIDCYECDPNGNGYFVGLVGKRRGLATPADTLKQEKQRKKYLSVKTKYTSSSSTRP